jgi:transposase InsO family protein
LQQSFEQLKERLVNSPVLALPANDGQFILDTDAVDVAIGAVLSQIQDGDEKVLAYASRLYSDAEKNYCVTRKELLAVVFFMKHFRQYLLGREFLVRTDHSALQWLQKTPEPIGQQGRWLELLEEYSFTVQHRPGREHGNADALSRVPCRQCGLTEAELDAAHCREITTNSRCAGPAVDWDRDVLGQHQREDPDLSLVYDAKRDSVAEAPHAREIESHSKETKAYCAMWPFLEMIDGVLYRRKPSGTGRPGVLQLLAPKAYRQEIMEQAHAGFSGGHLGERRTIEQVRRRAYWLGWASDVRKFCRQCNPCNQYWRGKAPKQGQLQPMTTGEPLERIGLDVTGPHPKSSTGYVYILTYVDYFSKWCDDFPMRNQEASTVASILVDRVFAYFGTPLQILTDKGRNFESELFQELCKRLQIDHVTTTAYKPSTNGLVERFHRTLNSMIAKIVAENQRNWDKCLPSVVAAYRATVHESTGYTPNYLFLGRENYAPLDLVMATPRDEPSNRSVNDFVNEVQERLQNAYSEVREHLKQSAVRRKRYYDLKAKSMHFKRGDWVWYFYPRRYKRISPKWQRTYVGPYLVMDQVGPVNYRIQKTKRSTPFVVHVDKLKLCNGPTPASWLSIIEESQVGLDQTEESVTDKPRETSIPDSELQSMDGDAVSTTVRPQHHRKLPARYVQRINAVPCHSVQSEKRMMAADLFTDKYVLCNCRYRTEMDPTPFQCRVCGVVKATVTALRNHIRRGHGKGRKVSKEPEAAPVPGATLPAPETDVVEMVPPVAGVVPSPSSQTEEQLATVSVETNASSSNAEALESRRRISTAIKSLHALQQCEPAALNWPLKELEARLNSVLKPSELPPAAVTAVVLTARYFFDVGRQCQPKNKAAQIAEARQQLERISLTDDATRAQEEGEAFDRDVCAGSTANEMAPTSLDLPEPLRRLHAPGEEADCRICTRRIIVETGNADKVPGTIVRKKRQKLAEAVEEVVEAPAETVSQETSESPTKPVSPPTWEQAVAASEANWDTNRWREDVWKSYATKEYQMPSTSAGSSPSSNDFPWGNDSPVEPLEPGYTGFKWHQLFQDSHGKAIG